MYKPVINVSLSEELKERVKTVATAIGKDVETVIARAVENELCELEKNLSEELLRQ